MFTRGTHLYRRLYCQTKPSSSSLSSHFSQSSNSSWTSLSSRSFLIGLPLLLQLRSWGFCLTFHSGEFQILCQFSILWWGWGGLWWHWQRWWQLQFCNLRPHGSVIWQYFWSAKGEIHLKIIQPIPCEPWRFEANQRKACCSQMLVRRC